MKIDDINDEIEKRKISHNSGKENGNTQKDLSGFFLLLISSSSCQHYEDHTFLMFTFFNSLTHFPKTLSTTEMLKKLEKMISHLYADDPKTFLYGTY